LVVDVGFNAVANGTLQVALKPRLVIAEREQDAKVKRIERESAGENQEVQLGWDLKTLGFAERSLAPLDRAPESSHRSDGRGVFVDPPPSLACSRTADLLTEEVSFSEENVDFQGARRISVGVGKGWMGFDRDASDLELVLEHSAQATVHGVVR